MPLPGHFDGACSWVLVNAEVKDQGGENKYCEKYYLEEQAAHDHFLPQLPGTGVFGSQQTAA